MNKLRTTEEAKAWLVYHGITVSQWAREHGFSQALVREVLAGRKKGLRGQSHNIAVALHLKRGVPTSEPARVKPEHTQAPWGGGMRALGNTLGMSRLIAFWEVRRQAALAVAASAARHGRTAQERRMSTAAQEQAFALRYALNRHVPDMPRGFVICTHHGELHIEPGRLAQRMADLVCSHALLELDRLEAPGAEGAQP